MAWVKLVKGNLRVDLFAEKKEGRGGWGFIIIWQNKKVNWEVAIKRGNPDLKGMGSTRLQGPWGTWTNYVRLHRWITPHMHTYTLHTANKTNLFYFIILLFYYPNPILSLSINNTQHPLRTCVNFKSSMYGLPLVPIPI